MELVLAKQPYFSGIASKKQQTNLNSERTKNKDSCQHPLFLSGSQLHWGVVLTVTVATIVYCLLGGLIFQAIERPNEETQYKQAMEHFNRTLRKQSCTPPVFASPIEGFFRDVCSP